MVNFWEILEQITSFWEKERIPEKRVKFVVDFLIKNTGGYEQYEKIHSKYIVIKKGIGRKIKRKTIRVSDHFPSKKTKIDCNIYVGDSVKLVSEQLFNAIKMVEDFSKEIETKIKKEEERISRLG